MRDFIVTEEFKGTLKIGNKFEYENVRCKFQYDVYSNRTMKGEFVIEDSLEDELFNIKRKEDELYYSDNDGRIIKADFNSVSLNTVYNTHSTVLNFNAIEYHHTLRYSGKPSKKLTIIFDIPYISAFSRKFKSSRGYDDSYIIKFINKPLVIKCRDYSVTFDESASLVDYKEPDYIFNRWILPKIEFQLIKEDDFYEIINSIEKFMYDVSLIISLLIHHQIHWYAYSAQTFDSDGRLAIDYKLKTRKRLCGQDFLKEVKREFNDFFTDKNIAGFIDNFRGLDNEKDILRKIIYGYISIGKMDILEPQFITAYSELEAISKLILKPIKQTGSEELIKDSMKKFSIGPEEFNFRISPKKVTKPSNKFEWLITDYRNYLIHSNNDNFNLEEIVVEFSKMMTLLRKLIIAYLQPDLKDFPYPSDKYYFTNKL